MELYVSTKSTTTMAPVIMSSYMTSRLPDGSIMESLHIATLQIPGLSKQDRHIHITPKMKIAPLISLELLCDYGCTITLYKQEISV